MYINEVWVILLSEETLHGGKGDVNFTSWAMVGWLAAPDTHNGRS